MDKSKIRKSIVKSINILSADCNQEIKDIENLTEAWHITLRNVSDEQIWNGLKKALDQKSPFMIGSGAFKELALTGIGHDSFDSEAIEAWSEIMKNLNYYLKPVFKNNAISETIRRMGGWRSLCNILESEEPFRKKDFITHYRTYRSRGLDYDQNVINYSEDQKLVFIGFSSEDEIKQAEELIKTKSIAERKALKMLA